MEPNQHIAVPASPWPVFAVASVAVFMVSMDATVLYAAFGALRGGFPRSDAAALSWVLNAYTVVFAAMLIPAGGLADARGRKRCFQVGSAIFLAASVGCGLATDVGWLVAARVLQALGAALLTPASLSLVLAAFPVERRAVAVGLWGAMGGLAAAVGPGLGSLIVDHLGWPWAFFINVPPGLWALWRGRAVLTESVRPEVRPRLDWIGMALVVAGVGLGALAIVKVDSPHWSGAQLAGAGTASLLCLLVFAGWVRWQPNALVDPALFRVPTFRWANLATLSFAIAFAMMFFGLFFYLTEVWHYGLTQAGLAVMPGPLSVVPVAAVSGRVAARRGHRPLLLAGSMVYGLAAVWFLLVPGDTPAYLTTWLPGMLMSGCGVGLLLPSLSGAAVAGLPPASYAVGSGVNQATRQIGSVIGVALIVLLLGKGATGHATFVTPYLVQLGLTVLTGLLCLGIRTAPPPVSGSPASPRTAAA